MHVEISTFQFLVLDAGGAFVLLGSVSNTVSITTTQYTDQMQQSLISTCAAECMRQHLNDCIDFIGDLHTLSKVKVRRTNAFYSRMQVVSVVVYVHLSCDGVQSLSLFSALIQEGLSPPISEYNNYFL